MQNTVRKQAGPESVTGKFGAVRSSLATRPSSEILGVWVMSKFAIRDLGNSLKIVFIVILVGLVSQFVHARTNSATESAESSSTPVYWQTVLHTFTNTPDGSLPQGGLVADKSGNLYGATQFGGSYGVGSIFELTPDGSGGYTYNLIYSLTGGVEGSFPSSLTIDQKGNLYCTTLLGGANPPSYYGTVFELSPDQYGNWTVSNYYDFTATTDGEKPETHVIVDSEGNVYGTTWYSYSGSGAGTVFELQLVNNQWFEKTLYTFNDQNGPLYATSVLLVDSKGNLYCAAKGGGEYGQGAVFKLHNAGRKGWKLTILHSFAGGAEDGMWPEGDLVFDQAGNIYGTAASGLSASENGYGGVFKLTPSKKITWLYNFTGGDDGGNPVSGVVFDKAGSLYGVTANGTNPSCYYDAYCGVVFQLTPSTNKGKTVWTRNSLFSFAAGSDGSYALGPLLLDDTGNIFGVAEYGGAAYGVNGYGVVFELTPDPANGASTTTKLASSPNSSNTGQTVTVSFVVATTGKNTPTGDVTVNGNPGEACTGKLTRGSGSCQIAFNIAGSRTLIATYVGDANNDGSQSAAVTQTVLNSTTSTITGNSPNPSKVGQSVVVNFAVAAPQATGSNGPTGNVTVTASTGESCQGKLQSSYNGACVLVFSSKGSRTLIANYPGDTYNQGSVSAAVTQAVN
jgi:uncharacterized repeat protein (TIGR03803 family)